MAAPSDGPPTRLVSMVFQLMGYVTLDVPVYESVIKQEMETAANAVVLTSEEQAATQLAKLEMVLLSILPIFAVFMLLFCCLRSRFRHVYAPKTMKEYHQDQPLHSGEWRNNKRFKELPSGLLSWIMPTIRMSDDRIFGSVGLDYVMIVVFFRACFFLFTVISLIYGFVVLLPIVLTTPVRGSGGVEDDMNLADLSGINRWTVAVITSSQSDRLWAHTIGAYLFSFLAYYLFYRAYRTFAEFRIKFLKRHWASNYTVMIDELPRVAKEQGGAALTSSTLKHIFEELYPGEVVSAHVTPIAPSLILARDDLEKAMRKLEKAEKVFEIKDERPEHKLGLLGLIGEKVDSIKHWRSEIDRLRKEIKELKKSPLKAMEDPGKLAKLTGAVSSKAPIKKGSKDKSADDDATLVDHLTPVGFVTFTTVRRASQVAQVLLYRDMHSYRVTPAPSVEDIIWSQLKMNQKTITRNTWIVRAVCVAMIVYWSVIVAFVGSLANIDALTNIPVLGTIIVSLGETSAGRVALGFLAGVLPVVVVIVLLAVLPIILRKLSLLAGERTYSGLDIAVLDWYYLFLIVTVFFAFMFGGASTILISKASEIVANPPGVFTLLGVAVPQQSFLFVFYLIQAGIGSVGGAFCRLVPLILGHIKAKFLAKTELEKKEAFQPGPYPISKSLPKNLLLFTICMTYAIVTPLILPACIIYWALTFLQTKYALIYVHVPQYTGKGEVWHHLFARVYACIFLFNLTITGLLAVKGAALQSALTIPLLVATIVMFRFTKETFKAPARYLSEHEARLLAERGRTGKEFGEHYIHAAFSPLKKRWDAKLKRVPITVFKGASSNGISSRRKSKDALDEEDHLAADLEDGSHEGVAMDDLGSKSTDSKAARRSSSSNKARRSKTSKPAEVAEEDEEEEDELKGIKDLEDDEDDDVADIDASLRNHMPVAVEPLSDSSDED